MNEIFSSHYPGRLHRAYIVDAPVLFSYLWAAISFFLDKVTYEK